MQVMLLDKETLEGTGDDSDHLHSAASDQKPPFICDSSCFNQFYERLVAPPKSGGAGGEDDQCKKVARYVSERTTTKFLVRCSPLILLNLLDLLMVFFF